MNAVDTNVLVYACDPRNASKQGTAATLIETLDDPVLLWQVACEYQAAMAQVAADRIYPGTGVGGYLRTADRLACSSSHLDCPGASRGIAPPLQPFVLGLDARGGLHRRQNRASVY